MTAQPIFRSTRARQPMLVLTARHQADAFLADRDAAAKRRDMREVHRIEAEARRVRLAQLGRARHG